MSDARAARFKEIQREIAELIPPGEAIVFSREGYSLRQIDAASQEVASCDDHDCQWPACVIEPERCARFRVIPGSEPLHPDHAADIGTIAAGYCKHGVWVGGMGVDWMCGRCEDDDDFEAAS